MTVPERLYKYQPFSAQALQNLKNQVLYFGSPLQFNDPYDCALSPRIKEISDTEVERVRQRYLSDSRLKNPQRTYFETADIPTLRAMLLRVGGETLTRDIAEFPKKRGVACFSERNDSLLMWSHYADHCRGFCLGFALRSSELEGKVQPVKYIDEMPVIDVIPALCDGVFDQVFDLYCTKGIDWKYEAEWRGLHGAVGTEYVYPSEVLTDIYFGPDMPFAAFEIVVLILASQNERVRLWQGARSSTKFSVSFEQVTYTSHLEAKRQGLL